MKEKWNEEQAIEELSDKFYRAIATTRKTTAEEILYYLKANITDNILKNHEIINWLMKEYNIEVK